MQRRRRSLNQGDVVLVNWPFTDLSGAKLRPAVVVSNNDHNREDADIVLVAVSSNVTRASHCDLALRDKDPGFSASGLKQSSTLRCSKLFTAEAGRLIRRRLGRLTEEWLHRAIDVVNGILVPSRQ